MIKEQLDETTEVAKVLNDIATVGAILKAAREKKGATIEAVALQLHLRPRILNDIEADNFTNISSNTYARGYIKNYARVIDADMVAIKLCLDQQIPEYVPPTMQSFSRKTTRQARDSRVNLVTYAIVIILLAMLVLWWVQKSDLLTESNFALPTVEEMQADTATQQNYPVALVPTQRDIIVDSTGVQVDPATVPAEQVNSQGNESVDSNADNSQPAVVTSAADSVVSHTNMPNTPSAVQDTNALASGSADSTTVVQNNTQPSGNASIVTMALNADCWVNLVDVTGKVLVDGVKKAGHSVKVTGEAPFKLILGAPQSVTLTIDGSNVDLSEYENGRVARLTLTKP